MDAQIQQLTEQLRELTYSIRQSTLVGGIKTRNQTNQQRFATDNKDAAKASADRQRIEKAMKEGTRALKDAFKNTADFGRDMKVANKMFQTAVDKLSLKQFDELPKRISALTKDIGMQFETKADIDKAIQKYDLDNIKASKELHDKLITLTIGTKEYNVVLDRLTARWSGDISELAQTQEQLIKTAQDFGKAIKKETLAIEQAAKDTATAAKVGMLLAEVLGYVGEQAYEAAKATAKYGVEFPALAEDMKLLGMSADELAAIQHESTQAVRGAGESFSEFDDGMIHAARDLAGFTGSLGEGAKIYAQAFRNSRMLSASQTDQSKIIQGSIKNFKMMHDTIGMTSEEFQQMNQQLMSNSDIQVNMYRLGQNQRAQAIVELQTQNALLRNLGLMNEEAQAVQATFAEMGAAGPKERRKQAAQLMAVGGALGMGDQARQLAMMLQRGETNTPEFAKLTQEIQTRAQRQYAAVRGTAGEFAQYALTNLPGVRQILGQQGPVAALATRGGLRTGDQTPRAIEKSSSMADKRHHEILGVVTGIGSMLAGIKPLIQIIAATLALQTFTKILGSVFGKGLGSLAGLLRGGAAAGGAAEAAGGAGLGAAGAGILGTGAAVLGAGAAGYGIGKLINIIPELWGGEDLSTRLGEWMSDKFGPKLHEPSTSKIAPQKAIENLIAQKEDQFKKAEGHADQQKMFMDQLDSLVEQLAKLTGKDPTKAIEDMHKTLKQQHQENKQMTQDQTDAISKQKSVVMKKTSGSQPAVGTTS